jgi:hypothetical protein
MKTCPTLCPTRLSPVIRRSILLIVLILLAGASPAWAQLSRIGSVTALVNRDQIGAGAIKGTDSNWDPVNDVYLVVGAYGPHFGIFVNRFGIPVTSFFFIKPNISGGSHFPRARYSPHVNGGAGGFLVTWSEEGAQGQNRLHTRVVAYPGILVGVENIISDSASYPRLEMGAAIGYSPVSQRFYVSWTSNSLNVMGRLVGLDGAGIGGIQTLAGRGFYSGVAWNAVTNEFGVSLSGETSDGSSGFSAFARVSPVDGSFIRQTFNFIPGFTFISDIDYNAWTGRYLMTWWQHISGGSDETHIAEIDAAGNIVTTGLVTTVFAGYNSLALAFNVTTGTSALVSLPATDQVYAAELNVRGFRTSPVTEVGPGVIARYTRVSANNETPEWNSSFVHGNDYAVSLNLIIGTTSTGGGPGGAYGAPGAPPPPPTGGTPPPPPPGGCTTPQPASDWVCVGGNWLPPSSGGSTNPSCPTTQPAPDWTCVNGDWLPPSSGGGGSSCTTPQPNWDWTCVNGNWLPPSSGGGSTCTTPQPDQTWTCVNGNWLPPSSGSGSTCTTPQPDPSWTCSNGNWLPPGSGGGSSTCTTPQPDPSWTCSNGNWLPPNITCTTPQPGPTWICVNGNWLPGEPVMEIEMAAVIATTEPPPAMRPAVEPNDVTADRPFARQPARLT